jgi:hypothetical protein
MEGNSTMLAVPFMAGLPVLVAVTVTFWLDPIVDGA